MVAKFGTKKGLEMKGLQKLFHDFADSAQGRLEIAKRVLHFHDKNRDGAISHDELSHLVSATDGQIALGTLDTSSSSTPLVKLVSAA